MNASVITIQLNEAIQRKGVTLYWVAKNSGIPYVTLWTMSQKENAGATQESINLSVLSRLCSVLDCLPGDLLRYTPDAEDKAIVSLVKAKDGVRKAAKKKGARAK